VRKLSELCVWLSAAAWAAMVLCGIYMFITLEPEGSGFTRGGNRLSAFLTWQSYALLAAFAASFAGRGGRTRGLTKRASQWPIFVSGGFFAIATVLLIGLIVYAKLA
jgi:hypothetical protein